MHSWSLSQGSKAGLRGRHDSSPVQYDPAAQMESPLGQPVWQRGTSSRQVRGAQLVDEGWKHAPCPSHVPALVSLSPTQVVIAQIVPSA